MSAPHRQAPLDGLYTISPSSSPSPSVHAATGFASLPQPQSGEFQEDRVYSNMYTLQNALRSTDLAVKNQALESVQRFISEMHHVIKDLKKDRAEAQARLVNIAASSRGKALRDDKNGGSGALLLPNDATALADVLKAQALNLGSVWTILHSLYAPPYLCGTAPPAGWDWTDHVLRNRDDHNRMLGNVSELFSCAPEPVKQYILRAEDPFRKNFFKTCGSVRATIISRCIIAAPLLLLDFREAIDQSVEAEETRTATPLRFQDEAGISRPLEFGDMLFNRHTEGRDRIPALRRLIGLSVDPPTRWADCLYEDGVRGPGKVPFGHQSLLDVASIMLYGQKAPQTRKLVFRSDSQLASRKSSLETTPSLIASAGGVVRYLMSADKEFLNSGVGSISGIHYAEDIEEYKYFLTKNWEHPHIRRIVERWNRRLFPNKRARDGLDSAEDFTDELEAATANLNLDDSADALTDALNTGFQFSSQDMEPSPPDVRDDFPSSDNHSLPFVGGGPICDPVTSPEVAVGQPRSSHRMGFQVENADYAGEFGSDDDTDDDGPLQHNGGLRPYDTSAPPPMRAFQGDPQWPYGNHHQHHTTARPNGPSNALLTRDQSSGLATHRTSYPNPAGMSQYSHQIPETVAGPVHPALPGVTPNAATPLHGQNLVYQPPHPHPSQFNQPARTRYEPDFLPLNQGAGHATRPPHPLPTAPAHAPASGHMNGHSHLLPDVPMHPEGAQGQGNSHYRGTPQAHNPSGGTAPPPISPSPLLAQATPPLNSSSTQAVSPTTPSVVPTAAPSTDLPPGIDGQNPVANPESGRIVPRRATRSQSNRANSAPTNPLASSSAGTNAVQGAGKGRRRAGPK